MRKRLLCELEAERGRRTAGLLEPGDDARIVSRVDYDEHVLEVLCGRADHAGAADVDLLDQVAERDAGFRRRLYERIQIHDDDVDRGDAVLPKGSHVVGTPAPGEDAAVDRRVQRLDAAVHDFGKAGDRRDAGDRYTGGLEGARGAAGRHELVPAGGQGLGERQQAGLVGDADEGSRHCRGGCPTELTGTLQVIIISAALARIAPSTEGRTVAVFFFEFAVLAPHVSKEE